MSNTITRRVDTSSCPCLHLGRRFPEAILVIAIMTLMIVAQQPGLSEGVLSHSTEQDSVLVPTVIACQVLVVPTQYPTIQGAINAANSCDTIQVLPGTYAEQLSINKSITIVGNSSRDTIIQAPSKLVTDAFGFTEIVQIASDFTVTMTDLNITGPGPGPFESLYFGIDVRVNATLEMSSSVVTHIRDNPVSNSTSAGIAIAVGGHATIINSVITDYQLAGIVAHGARSSALIRGNTIVGQGFTPIQGLNYGIAVDFGAEGTVEFNTVSNNQCNLVSGQGELCGPKIHGNFQTAGIFALSEGNAKTMIRNNSVFNNDVGIYIENPSSRTVVSHNTVTNSGLYGLELQDSNNTFSRNLVLGGPVGAAVGADFVNSVMVLARNTFVDQSVATSEAQSFNGYNAIIIFKE